MNDDLRVDLVTPNCALLDFNVLITASSSSTVKSNDGLASAAANLESEVTSRDVKHAKSLSASIIQKLRSDCICCYWKPRVPRAWDMLKNCTLYGVYGDMFGAV